MWQMWSPERHLIRVRGEAGNRVLDKFLPSHDDRLESPTSTRLLHNVPGGEGVSAGPDPKAESFYDGRVRASLSEPGKVLATFPEPIYAANKAHAFGRRAYYDARTGERLGDLGFQATVYAPSIYPQGVWVVDPDGKVRHFREVTR